MNLKVFAILFILLAIFVNVLAHKRVKRMRFLTDTDYRTNHTDELYKTIFAPEETEKLFYKKDGLLIIRDQDNAIKFDGRKYYWYGLIYSFWKTQRTCYYPAGKDPELKNVRFQDGSSVKSIMFGCYHWFRCCGTDCCFETVFFTAILILFLVVGIFAIVYAVFKHAKEAPLSEVEIALNDR